MRLVSKKFVLLEKKDWALSTGHFILSFLSSLTLLSCYILVIEEKGVKMKLTVIDTPGFGDQINNENW